MTPERHEQIARLHDEALELAPGQRVAFLETACAGDPALRQEVESLLALGERAKDFIEVPALAVAAELLAEESGLFRAGRMIGFYRILSPLGAGGMGEVYLAEDTRLGRKIALKLLPARFTQDPDRLRWFEQEARAASALNHPNIVTIHDIGQADGRHYIATEFIDGQTVRQKIASQPMKLEEAIDVAIQAANALAAAHAAGVVHRDIKPENIMVRPDGYVKVLDFGLAKLTTPSDPNVNADTPAAVSLATTGVVVGTARYMSPEQARGQRVDARSDIFSLGVVLYEMLAGESPFAGDSVADVIAAILGHEPRLTRDLPEAPEALEQIISRSLRKDRDERYQTAQAMIADLKALKHQSEPGRATGRTASSAEHLFTGMKLRKKSVLLAAAAVLLIAGSSKYFRAPADTIDSIAVLPFENESKDPGTEYLSDGISDILIHGLSQVPGLRTVSFSAVLPYKGKLVDPKAVGDHFRVRAVATGGLNLSGSVLSVRAQLVDVRDNRTLWHKEYANRRPSELLQVQNEILGELRLILTGGEAPGAKRETESVEAHNFYQLGRFQWHKLTGEGLRKSIDYFLEAVAEDPKYARAYAGLADAHSMLGEASYVRPKEAFALAKLYAEKALSLDQTLGEAHLSLGIVKLFHDWDWQGAEEALSTARKRIPNDPHVYHFYGHYLEVMGRTEEAVKETQLGLDADLTSLFLNAELAWAYYLNRQYDEAITQGRKTLELDENFAFASWTIAQAYGQRKMYQEALDELKRAREPSKDWSWIVAEIGYVNARLGWRTEALKIVLELEDRMKDEYIDPILIAYIHIELDNKDEAFSWLEKAFRERTGMLPWLKVEPKFDPLRGDRRFDSLAKRVGLPQ